jgi:hypothetical protein
LGVQLCTTGQLGTDASAEAKLQRFAVLRAVNAAVPILINTQR